jgi:hypothetical protein
MEKLHSFASIENGLDAYITYGNDKHNYRLVYRDTDASEIITTTFSNNIDQLICKANEFIK